MFVGGGGGGCITQVKTNLFQAVLKLEVSGTRTLCMLGSF